MSEKVILNLITRMHIRLNALIEENNFNLMDKKVQDYSRRLDKVIMHYDKIKKRNSRVC